MRRITLVALCGALLAAGSSADAKPSQPTPSDSPPAAQRSWSFSWSTGRGRLGAQVMSMTPELRAYFGGPADAGVLVAKVEDGSPAHQLGLQAGDVIVEVDGTRIGEPGDVRRALAQRAGGGEVPITFVRNRRTERRRATLPADGQGGTAGRPPDLRLPELPALPELDFDWFDQHFRWPAPWTRPSPDGERRAGRPAPKSQRESPALRQELRDARKRLRELERRLERLEKHSPQGRGGRT